MPELSGTESVSGRKEGLIEHNTAKSSKRINNELWILDIKRQSWESCFSRYGGIEVNLEGVESG